MKIFVTGATGFIGFALVKELIGAGHQVLGLARTDAGAQALIAAGAEAHRGDLEDLESLRSGAAAADAVIHTAFIHDFSRFQEVCEIDRRAIETLGAVIEGTDHPMLVTSGIPPRPDDRPTTEDDPVPPVSAAYPRASEQTAAALEARGVHVAVVRLPQVHDTVKQGLVTLAIAAARDKGVSAYVGDGLTIWAAVHVLDAARLYRLALEQHQAGARYRCYQAVAEEGVRFRDMAEAIGRGLHAPVVAMPPAEAAAHFGFLAPFAGMDLRGSSAKTQARLGWHPAGPGLITDLEHMRYF